jgi:release factor glutamine methyltransferase
MSIADCGLSLSNWAEYQSLPILSIRSPKSAINMSVDLQNRYQFNTVREAVAQAARELAQAKIESPHLTAELLLGHVLGWDRIRVLTDFPASLDEQSKERFVQIVHRRIDGEPLQYLTGKQEFYGRAFCVSPAVLIPRPETEILVESVLSVAANQDRELRFIDVGTGSGCIAVSVAAEMPRWLGWAVDLSPEALVVARQNAIHHRVSHRIQFVCSDLLESFPAEPVFDFVLSNPPYVARRSASTLPEIVQDYEPPLALFGGEFGLEVYSRLIPQAATRLLPEGHLVVEVGLGQSRDVACLMEREGLSVVKILDDLRGIPRCVLARKN